MLDKFAEEDPTFQVRQDEDTGQTIISGMGELHLEIITERLLREFNAQVNVGKPQVVYRETIEARAGEAHLRPRDRRAQHYAKVRLEALPLARGAGSTSSPGSPRRRCRRPSGAVRGGHGVAERGPGRATRPWTSRSF